MTKYRALCFVLVKELLRVCIVIKIFWSAFASNPMEVFADYTALCACQLCVKLYGVVDAILNM